MPFTFSNAFNRFFSLLGSNFIPFLLVGGVGVIAPAVALNYGIYTWIGTDQVNWMSRFQALPPQTWAYGLGGGLLMWLLNLMTLSAITEVAILRSVGKGVNYGAIIGHALMNAIPLFIVSFFTTLLVFAGFFLLFVPGFIWMLCTCIAVPAYVSQTKVGIFGAIGKSFELTRNHRWQLLLLFIVVGIGEMVLSGAISSASFAMPGGITGLPSRFVQAFGSGLCQVLSVVFIASLYVSLRESKDKISPDTAAAVF